MRTARRIFGIVALVGFLASPLGPREQAHASPAHAASINGFYAISKAEYDKRYASTSYVPVKSVTLPSGTTYIGVAWFWSGAAKQAPFFIVLRHHLGATINVAGPYTYKVTSGNSATYFYNGTKPFADGVYDLDLVLSNAFAATTTVKIGGSGGGESVGGGSGGSVGGASITALVATTPTALAKWIKQPGLYPLPVSVSHYPAGTTQAAFCYIYKGGTPSVTTYLLVLHGPNGLTVTGGNKPLIFKTTGGGVYSYRTAPQHLAYPNGAYTAVVLVNGKEARQIHFTIG